MAKRKVLPVQRISLSSQDYLHGELVVSGKRQALVVRTEEGRWTWFPYQECRQVILGFARKDTTKDEAYRDAIAYVKNGVLPKAPSWVQLRVSLEPDELVVKYLAELQSFAT